MKKKIFFVLGEPKVHCYWELTKEGQSVVENGSHEALIFNAVPPDTGIEQSKIMATVPNAKVGFSKAMSQGWVFIDKSSGAPVVKRKVNYISDVVRQHLKLILNKDGNSVPDNVKQDYKKRKLIQEVVIKSILLSKGSEFQLSVEKQETDLTAELLLNDAWKNKTFKDYNFNSLGVLPNSGHLHPLMKVRAEFRKIFIEMGFQEVRYYISRNDY